MQTAGEYLTDVGFRPEGDAMVLDLTCASTRPCWAATASRTSRRTDLCRSPTARRWQASAGLVERLRPAEDEMVGPCLRGRGAWGQAVLMAETSNSRVTFSLTRTPPVSSATFQVTP
jgi:hypothetical protein